MTLHRKRAEGGFTLVETLAALVVFGIVTLGVVPLLSGAVRGASLSRSITVGKNLALDSMERIRGLPYFIAYGAQNKRVDVLDLYYPTYTAATGLYRTTCTSATTTTPACPKQLPSGYTITYEARFVTPSAGDVSPQTYSVVVPSTDYAWNSLAAKDLPPTRLLEMTINVTWTNTGRSRSFRLRTLIGDRKFGDVKMNGTARVDYTIQVLTQFVDATGQKSELIALAGTAESRIETRLLTSADQFVRAATIRLVELPAAEGLPGIDLDSATGATSSLHAPPDTTSSGATGSDSDITHPKISDPRNPSELFVVAAVDDTETRDVRTAIGNETPLANGYFDFRPGGSNIHLWVKNQADTGNDAVLRLDPTRRQLSFRAPAGGSDTITGGTAAVTVKPPDAGRKVDMTATAQFRDMRVLPTTFISTGIVTVDTFSANVNCRSTANSGTDVATATWTATLRYWAADQNGDGNFTDPGYRSVSLSSAELGGGDPLATIKSQNPLVYSGDPLLPSDDIYLFNDPALGRAGYLDAWSAQPGVVTSDATGRTTTAIIDGALRIDTAPTNPLLPESGLNISIGKLNCEAVDQR